MWLTYVLVDDDEHDRMHPLLNFCNFDFAGGECFLSLVFVVARVVVTDNLSVRMDTGSTSNSCKLSFGVRKRKKLLDKQTHLCRFSHFLCQIEVRRRVLLHTTMVDQTSHNM